MLVRRWRTQEIRGEITEKSDRKNTKNNTLGQVQQTGQKKMQEQEGKEDENFYYMKLKCAEAHG